jgi:uncharacterized protein YbjT (DUF2867 family)
VAPEPVLTADGALGPLETAEQRDAVSLAFLLLLERLNARERAVFVLREAFAYEHREIAAILGVSEAGSRQLLSRARRRVAGPPSRLETGRAADLGGPQVLTIEELASSYLRAAGRRRPVVRVHVPGATARGFRAGGHLCPEHPDGTRTWAEFLAARYQKGR